MPALHRLANGPAMDHSAPLDSERSASKTPKDMPRSPTTSSNHYSSPFKPKGNPKHMSSPLINASNTSSGLFGLYGSKHQSRSPIKSSDNSSAFDRKKGDSQYMSQPGLTLPYNTSSPLNPSPRSSMLALPPPRKHRARDTNKLPRDALLKDAAVQNQHLRTIACKRLEEIKIPESRKEMATEVLTLREQVSLLTKEAKSLRKRCGSKSNEMKYFWTSGRLERKRREIKTLREQVESLKQMLFSSLEENEQLEEVNKAHELWESREPAFGAESSQSLVEVMSALQLGDRTNAIVEKKDASGEIKLALLREKDKEIKDMRADHQRKEQDWQREKAVLQKWIKQKDKQLARAEALA
ncbi:hypothetical protein K490DRAFT_61078 [Saccharata proteae CBS 121410]|uniref:Uncharacterized protein n=1 Tax=Saccharata proteae CBS 121410 TaxID=1314787 RepID=A0A9P4LZZ1_9PEZI|nr:hypothetical protein K490DRAFT_61078 [Saccharata proteae CBS 121410]